MYSISSCDNILYCLSAAPRRRAEPSFNMDFASEEMTPPYCDSPVLTLGQCWSDMKKKLGGFVYLPKGRKERYRENRTMVRAGKPKKS